MTVNCKFSYWIHFFLISIFFFIYTINGNAQLVADFTPDKAGGCTPLSVSFINQTSGASANAVYSWDFGNGNSAVTQSPGAIFKDQKTYTVTLTVKDGSQSSSKTKQITVYPPPALDFTATPVKGCLPVQVNFTATADGGNAAINNYTWDFGDGNIQQGAGALQSHVYTLAQKATVSLTVSNNFGCTKTVVKQNLVNILPAIQSSFTASQNILCRVTDPVQFSNTSSGPGTLTYAWDFGDGTTSSLAAPSHVFNLKGIYTVQLTVNSSEGCTATNVQNGFINVASFSSDFSVPSLICNSYNYVLLNNTSTPSPATSLWNVNGVDQYYNYGGLYYSFNTSGDYTVKLINSFGTCKDSVTKTVVVKPTPEPAGFISNISGHCGAPVVFNFKDTTPGIVKWEWNFNNYYSDSVQSRIQAPSFSYLSDGNYGVRLRVENADGCSATVYQGVTVFRPSVIINATGNRYACGPIQLKFNAILYPITDTLVTYKWDFGDGTGSTVAEPDHIFSIPGNYGITLTYTTSSGCTGIVSYGNITVYPKLVANFTASSTTVCGSTPITFNAVYQGSEVYYAWYLGESNLNTPASSITTQYFHDSVYTIRLIVTNQGGCTDTMTRTDYIRVLPPFPIIKGAVNTCDGNRGLVKFSQESRKVNAWKWDFGDGTSRILNVDSPDVFHNYAASGTYKVLLTGTNGQCSVADSTVVYVLLKQNPLLTASASGVCTNSQVQVKINNLQNNPWANQQTNYFYYLEKTEYNDLAPYQGSVYGQNYDWGNTYTGTLQTFEKSKTGIRMIIRSYNFGCADTTNFIPLSVKGSAAGFQVLTDNVCFKSAVVLKDTSKTNSKITSWQWSFGDGNYQTLDHSATVSHVYTNPGSYSVSLQVTDTSGCYTSSNAQNGYVSVNGPKAIFNPSASNTFITLPVYFYNYTNNYNSYNTVYAWSFGDGTTSADYSPTHDYPVPGQYTVRLIAKNPATNCTDTMSQVIIVNNFNPAFAYSSSFLTAGNCPPVLVRLSNNSINYTSVKWDFGDGITADNINYPAHVYEKPGKYIITLYVYGPGGLTGTYLDSITIQNPTALLKVDKKLGCIGLVSTLNGTIKSATSFTWDFGDGTLLSNKDTMVSHQYNIPGIYQPLLVMIDTNGCNSFASLNESITIRKNPEIIITPTAPLICRGKFVALTASGGSSYIWSPAKGLSNTGIAAPNASPDSNTLYRLTVKDDIGCSNKDSILVTVVQKQKVKVSVDTAICFGKTTRLIASGAGVYNWINNTTGLSNTTIPDPVASPVVNTTFTVTGSDVYKCFSDTARVTVLVLPLPTVNIAPVPEILLGSPVPLLSNYSNDVVQWTWSPADYLNCSNCPAPLSTPLAAVTYQLLVKNNVGCTATAQVTLKLQCQENRVFIPSAFSPNNDGNNDLFSIKGISIVKHMIIFNRWGKPVYERSNYIASDRNNGWDGTYKGDLMPAGAYTYFAEMECPAGGSFVKKGTVMLIR